MKETPASKWTALSLSDKAFRRHNHASMAKTNAICYLLCGARVKDFPTYKKKEKNTFTKHDHNLSCMSSCSMEHAPAIQLTKQKWKNILVFLFFIFSLSIKYHSVTMKSWHSFALCGLCRMTQLIPLIYFTSHINELK